ncbi:hypothetical protein ACYG9R_12955 [Mesorhizobium sp. RSR565B]|uniref:hypothetical protein n=1 Tax=unclassified Mesorhizobium TaxID=325217 RepID=UPI0003CFFFD2|nr:hypothetical protein [Mesorhizobium sp. L103C565B0]ESZ47325.1 hypothetical protein X730_16995 [Mesorhizobium sp. L103C565B0]
MKSAAVLFALATMLAPTGLRAADYCDDKIELGESPDGLAMTMVGSMMSLVLAERYCGALPKPFSQIYVVVEEGHGCGPRVRLEAEFKKKMEEEKATDAMIADSVMHDLIADGTDLPQAEMDKRAKAIIEGQLGGCSKLLKIQRDVQERYRNPPKWPREPDK